MFFFKYFLLTYKGLYDLIEKGLFYKKCVLKSLIAILACNIFLLIHQLKEKIKIW